MAERDVTMWAGGGRGWEPDPAPAEPPPPKKDEPPPPKEPEKKKKAFVTALGGTGVVCGRFLPLHRGHEYVVDVARGSVQDLLVLVFATAGDPIPGEVRVRWLRELYPDVAVELVERTAPALLAPDPSELVAAVARHRDRPQFFFASEPAYAAAAAALGATFVPVDVAREVFPISGTALRADVMRHFAMLAAPARPWFVRRVAVIGAESTGKSTLCAQLAEHFSTLYVPEHARSLAEQRGDLDGEALALAARGQLAAEEALARRAHRVVFCDTDPRTAALWHERLYGPAPAWMHVARAYDLVLLTSLDEPFAGRADRDRPAARRAFHATLRAANPGAIELSGGRSERLAQATAAVDG
ncbi:MAG TPA: AAA family ATPase, partial [Kofleriaceae bacterium]|nr:AAA family ATPase [Kofleriaceae bacterium]